MPRNSGRAMTWCSHCGKDCVTSYECTSNTTSCVNCGKVLFEGDYLESHRRTFQNGNVATNESIYKETKVSHTVHYKVLNGKEMLWCPHCVRKGGTTYDHDTASTQCIHCGKILHEDIYTEQATLLHALRRKHKKKLALDAKSLKLAKTAAGSVGNLLAKKIPSNCSYAIRKEPVKEDLITEDEEDSEQESCDHDYSYDYDGGDEYDDYLS